MEFKVRIWRQPDGQSKGTLVVYDVHDINPDMSFLEMLDVLNEELIQKGEDPVAFDHDCREGICGACGLVINGLPHGKRRQLITTCQLHMRSFKHKSTITIEPWRATAFPVVKDLVVDRGALDRVIYAGGYIGVSAGSAPDANTTPVRKKTYDLAMTAAACIGCGACVAVCPNASAMLFVGAKVSHLGLLPHGQPGRYERVLKLVQAMDKEGFGGCMNIGECTAICPKGIACSDFVSQLNRDVIKARLLKGKE